MNTQLFARDKFARKFSDCGEDWMSTNSDEKLTTLRALRHAVGWVLAVTLTCMVMACGSLQQTGSTSAVGKVAYHGFEFDVRDSKSKFQIIDFAYGNSHMPGTNVPAWWLAKGNPMSTTHIFGRIKVPHYLWVKWRLMETGEIIEDNVDLAPLLPSDMEDKRITLDINGKQLFLYLVLHEKRPPQIPPNGPPLYRESIVKTLYPPTARSTQ